MKKYLLILFALFITSIAAQGQIQFADKTVGLRTGDYFGFSARLNFENQMSLEGIIGRRDNGTMLTVRGLKFQPIQYNWASGFEWYYGLGVHVGTAKINTNKNNFFLEDWDKNYNKTVFASGINAALGIQYAFDQYPFTVGIELTPYFEIRQFRRFAMGNSGFSFTINYLLNSYK